MGQGNQAKTPVYSIEAQTWYVAQPKQSIGNTSREPSRVSHGGRHKPNPNPMYTHSTRCGSRYRAEPVVDEQSTMDVDTHHPHEMRSIYIAQRQRTSTGRQVRRIVLLLAQQAPAISSNQQQSAHTSTCPPVPNRVASTPAAAQCNGVDPSPPRSHGRKPLPPSVSASQASMCPPPAAQNSAVRFRLSVSQQSQLYSINISTVWRLLDR